MRRTDRERNDGGGGRGFRVLEAGGRYLEPLSPPPPPRAPEPYKVAPPSSSLGRAHRRSSFVIIAETRPATPSSPSPSPTLLATGRVSPFRGRGFKGPLPHAQSRPESPENHQQGGRRHGRLDRRASVSQQSSPKRSLIPQPTRRRSVSLTKTGEKKPSPKFGRRAPVARKNGIATGVHPNGGGNLSRRPSLKAPDLSPIQGTPTKPVEGGNSLGARVSPAARVRGGNSLGARVSPAKSRNSLAVPKTTLNTRRTGQDKSPFKASSQPKRFVEEKRPKVEAESPTKIPVRRGSIVNKNGSTQSLSSGRFAGKAAKSVDKAARSKNSPSKQETSSTNVEKRAPGVSGSRDDRKEDDRPSNPPGSRFIEIESPPEPKKRGDDLGLIDLLKKSSGATGTSSVVNTTTTTAVQPLQIEAAAILLENDRASNSEAASSKSGSGSPSPANPEVSPEASPKLGNEAASSKTPRVTNGAQETGTGERRIESGTNENGSSTTTVGSSNSMQKNPAKANAEEPNATVGNPTKKEPIVGANSGQSLKEKGAGKDQGVVGVPTGPKKSVLTRNGVQDGSRGEMRVASAKPGSRTATAINNSNNAGNERAGSGRAESSSDNVEASGKLLGGKPLEGVPSPTSGHRKTDSKGSVRSAVGSTAGNEAKRTLSRSVAAANPDKAEPDGNPGSRATENGEGNKFLTNHGSETSLKSSNGLSTVSVDSTRSTDTGVSVNTVRGVSSAREKKGMHMMKNSDEIETLSGNVMHLERNGEPAVLDIAEGAVEPQDQSRLGRLKRSLGRINDRLPSMRCLGCRRGRKGHAWLGEQRDEPRTTPPAAAATADSSGATGNGMWSNFKRACRCMRLRECKCCRRAARVAPAESTPCCPPERRCGALCRRLFSRCKCSKSEAERTRSIRAKHSLTSVAPPPLSEEQRSKIPEVLVEHNSVMRGAIPCLPTPLAWFCLIWNVLIPGTGTIWSGLFNLCVGQPRFAISASPRARFGALVVNLIVGVSQFFTVLFCLVGWGWSIWWGVTMIRLARKYKRFRASEAASSDLEARAGESTGLPPGVPSQALRGMERAR